MRPHVLLVAADIDQRAGMARALQSSGCAVELASDAKRALKLAADRHFAMVIVVSGSTSVVEILTLRDTVPRLIVLFERADALARLQRSHPEIEAIPFNKSNERAVINRIAEMLKSTTEHGEGAPAPSMLRMDGGTLDLAGYRFIAAEGREVTLSRAEADLLRELAQNPLQTLSREQLRRTVTRRSATHFEQDAEPFDRSIDMLVARVRRKIEPDPKAPQFLVTVPGVGYKLVVPQQNLDAIKAAARLSEPERRQITALCCGLVGAMNFAISLDPEDLSKITKSFQDAAIAAITRVAGTIAYVTPDQILAVFGYPEAHENDAERAVEAALDALTNIRQSVSLKGEVLPARVGIATGLVLAGPEQTIGGPAAIATALCAAAPENAVLITSTVRRLLSAAFICGKPHRKTLGEFSEPVNAFLVTGRRTVGSRFKATHPKKVTGLVGRERELHQLIALWERARRGEGQVALICGEAGIGKSHLSEFFLTRLSGQLHLTLRYQCSSQHQNTPFYPVISHLEHAMGFEPSDTSELKLSKLETALLQAGEMTPNDIGLYAQLLSISAPERELSPSLTPKRQKELTMAALIRHLQSIAAKQPLIIVLADVHWADSSTLQLVSRIIPLIKAARILLLIKFRPEFVPPWPNEPHVTLLRLERFGREESLAIISAETGGRNLPRELAEQILDRADGIPLFLEELTRAVMDAQSIKDAAHLGRATGPLVTPTVPATLLESLTARLDQLGAAKEIAQIGSAIGREFSGALLASIASDSASSLQQSLAQLVSSGLISVVGKFPDATYAFKHALVRDAAYATLSRTTRQRHHARIADVLENSFGFTVETQPELLAHHLAQAGLIPRAIEYLRKAARRAVERSANAEAITHLTRALELLQLDHDSVQYQAERFSLEAMLCQAMIERYGYAAQTTRDTLIRARTLVEASTEPSGKFAVLYGIWASHYVAGDVVKQRSAAADFLDEAERSKDTASKCVGHRLIGTTHLTTGEFAAGLRHLKQAWAQYNPVRHGSYRFQYGQEIGASTLCYLSWALWHLGYIEQGSHAATEALALADKLSHPHTVVYTTCHARGFMDLFRRRHEDMHNYARSVISICNEHGFLHWANCGAILNAWATVCAGPVDQGIQMLQEGVTAWQKAGARLWMPMFLTLQAQAFSKAGRNKDSLKMINRAIAICETTGERWAMAEVLRTKASLVSQAGAEKRGEVEAILLDSLDVAKRQGARSWQLRASCDLSILWERQGRNRQAFELLQPIYDQFTEGLATEDLRAARKLLQSLRRKIAEE